MSAAAPLHLVSAGTFCSSTSQTHSLSALPNPPQSWPSSSLFVRVNGALIRLVTSGRNWTMLAPPCLLNRSASNSPSIIASPSYPSLSLCASSPPLLVLPWVWISFSPTWTTARASELIFLHSGSSLWNPFSILLSYDSSWTQKTQSHHVPAWKTSPCLLTFHSAPLILANRTSFQFPKPGKPIHTGMLTLLRFSLPYVPFCPSLKTACYTSQHNSNASFSLKAFLPSFLVPIPRQAVPSLHLQQMCISMAPAGSQGLWECPGDRDHRLSPLRSAAPK